MEAYNFARRVQYHPIWVGETEEPQALVNAYFEKYFGCELSKIPEERKNDFFGYETLKRHLHAFMFDRRGIDVPEGVNRWEYLLKRWNADIDGIEKALQFELNQHGIKKCASMEIWKYIDLDEDD